MEMTHLHVTEAISNIQASLLDRLIDLDPSTSHESAQVRLNDFDQIKSQVKRDLENLLNTRCGRPKPPKRYQAVERSVLHYGLGDYSAGSPDSSALINRILTDVKWALRQFEPRIKDVRVELDVREDAQIGLSFRISGLLVVDPIREVVIFDTYYDSIKKAYIVSG
jgi:type VI secretion system protein ImpF